MQATQTCTRCGALVHRTKVVAHDGECLFEALRTTGEDYHRRALTHEVFAARQEATWREIDAAGAQVKDDVLRRIRGTR